MATSISSMREQALKLVMKRKYSKAADVYNKVIELEPKEPRNYLLLGNVYRRLHQTKDAIYAYETCAKQYALSGHLLKAISINKMILEIDPDHVGTQEMLSNLYAERQNSANNSTNTAKLQALFEEEDESPTKNTDIEADDPNDKTDWSFNRVPVSKANSADDGIEDAVVVGGASFNDAVISDKIANVDRDKLPSIPLFSSLSRTQFAAVLERLEVLAVEAGDVIVRQGDLADAFFIIGAGTFAALLRRDEEQVELGTMSDGQFFGEIGLLEGNKRTATVRAKTSGMLLRMSAKDLRNLMDKFPSLENTINHFTRQRLLRSILRSMPAFDIFSESKLHRIIECFTHMNMEQGDVLMRSGNTMEWMIVVESGSVELTDKQSKQLADKGSIIGANCALAGSVSTGSARCVTAGRYFVLPQTILRVLAPLHRETIAKLQENSFN